MPPHSRLVGDRNETYPIGLGYLSAYLKKHGFSAAILDMAYQGKTLKYRLFSLFGHRQGSLATSWKRYYKRIENENDPIWAEVLFAIEALRPKIVGVTATAITLPSAIRVIGAVKRSYAGVVTVIGGPATTTVPEEVAKCTSIDHVVVGEGEGKLLSIVDHVINGTDLVFDFPPIEDLDSLPFPDRDDVFIIGNKKELVPVHVDNILFTSRGCPYRCGFCATKSLWGSVRARSAKSIVDEIEWLYTNNGLEDFFFVDDLFMLSKKRINEFCKELDRRSLRVRWKCLGRLNIVDKQLIKTMMAHGCYNIAFGVESGSDRILKMIKKDLTVSMIKSKARILQETGIRWHCYVMVGFPTETKDEMVETLRLVNEIRPTSVGVCVFCPYPGTPLGRYVTKSGMRLDLKNNDMLNVEHNYTGTMTDDEFSDIAQRYIRFIDIYNSINSPPVLHLSGGKLLNVSVYLARKLLWLGIRIVKKAEISILYRSILGKSNDFAYHKINNGRRSDPPN